MSDIPLIRRLYKPLYANPIVSLQPILGPAGMKYYREYIKKIEKRKFMYQKNKPLQEFTVFDLNDPNHYEF